jgi:hypothetical protein
MGSTFSAPSNLGTIFITATSRYGRKYAWQRNSIELNLEPRKERWYGSLGIGLGVLPQSDPVLDHVILEEYQLHFHSLANLERDLMAARSANNLKSGQSFFYTADGLSAVNIFEKGRRSNASFLALESSIVQYCLGARKPVGLPGASKDIHLVGRNGEATMSLPCTSVDESGYYDASSTTQGHH